MKKAAWVLVVSSIVLLSPNTALGAEDQVLTIYFCGTGCTKDWYKASVSKFDSGELIASLYQMDLSDTDLWGGGPRHKKIVNGIGTGTGWLLDLLGAGIPDLPGIRGWDECLNEATDALLDVLNGHQSSKVILNLVGWSRGGILCFKMAREVMDPVLAARIKRINILAFDPVPGIEDPIDEFDAGGDNSSTLPSKVNHFVCIYARDERSYRFEPLIPIHSAAKRRWLFTVPGSHETLMGNTDKDGHTVHALDLLDVFTFKDADLKYVGHVSNAIAQSLLGSPEWGNIEFGVTWELEAELDFPVHPNGTSKGELEAFIGWMSLGNDHYDDMRGYAFTPLGFGTPNAWYWGTDRDHHLLESTLIPVSHTRSCFVANKRHAKDEWLWTSVPPWYVKFTNDEQVYWLENKIDPLSKSTAWSTLRTFTNSPPSADAGGPRQVAMKDWHTTTIQGTATDLDGDRLEYHWSHAGTDLTIGWPDVTSGQAPLNLGTITPLGVGTYALKLEVREEGPSNHLEEPMGVSDTMVLTVVDRTPPWFTNCQQGLVVVAECTSHLGTPVTYPALTAMDNWDPTPTITFVPRPGHLFPLGTTTVTATATDDAGNRSTPCTFYVTIEDTTPPVLHDCPSDVTLEGTSPDGAVHKFVLPTATDIADPDPVVTCTHVSGAVFPLGTTTVVCTATDASNNSSTCAFDVTVADTTPPTITCSVVGQRTLLWERRGSWVYAGGLVASASDICDPDPVVKVGVWSDEPNGPPPYAPDALFSGNRCLLRSECDVRGDGRVYLIRVAATDDSGNTGYWCTTVVVPHGRTRIAMMDALNAAADAEAICNGEAPGSEPGDVPAGFLNICPEETLPQVTAPSGGGGFGGPPGGAPR